MKSMLYALGTVAFAVIPFTLLKGILSGTSPTDTDLILMAWASILTVLFEQKNNKP